MHKISRYSSRSRYGGDFRELDSNNPAGKFRSVCPFLDRRIPSVYVHVSWYDHPIGLSLKEVTLVARRCNPISLRA